MTLACLRLSSIIVILCVLPASSYKLPEYEVYYKDGQTLKCLTRNDKDPCLPDTQIEACNRSGDKVQCVKCKPGLRLCDSSTSALPTKCYDPKDFCSRDGDNVVKVTDLPVGGCTISCVCNEDNGYTGSDPNQCDYNDTPCSLYTSRQFSPHIYCMPCPNGYFNPRDDGIDMCIPQTTGSTSESETSSTPQTTTGAPVQKVTESSTAVQTSSTTALPQEENHNGQIFNTMENISGDRSSQGMASLWYVWFLVIMVLVAILVGVTLYICCWHTQNKDEQQQQTGGISNSCLCFCGNSHTNVEVHAKKSSHDEPAPTGPLLEDDEQRPAGATAATDNTVPDQTEAEPTTTDGQAGADGQSDRRWSGEHDEQPGEHHHQPSEHDERTGEHDERTGEHDERTGEHGERMGGHNEQHEELSTEGTRCKYQQETHLPQQTEQQRYHRQEIQGGPGARDAQAGRRQDELLGYRSKELPPPYTSGQHRQTGPDLVRSNRGITRPADSTAVNSVHQQNAADPRVPRSHRLTSTVVTSDLLRGDTLTVTFNSSGSAAPVSTNAPPDHTHSKRVVLRPDVSECGMRNTENHTQDTYPSDGPQAMPLNQGEGDYDSSNQRKQHTEPKRKLSGSCLSPCSNVKTDTCEPSEGDPLLSECPTNDADTEVKM